jgi:hypothetical protein
VNAHALGQILPERVEKKGFIEMLALYLILVM